MRVIIIGCTQGGTTVADTILKVTQDVEITIIERNSKISYQPYGITIACQNQQCVPLEKMFNNSISNFKKQCVTVYLEHEAIDIDFNNKFVIIQNLTNETKKQVEYDQLVIATGAMPKIPKYCQGLSHIENVFMLKSYSQGKSLQQYITRNRHKGKKVAILGAGQIGVQMIETFVKNNFYVKLIEGEDRIMKNHYDKKISDIVTSFLQEQECEVHFGKKVANIQQKEESNEIVITMEDGTEIYSDAVLLSIGFTANTSFLLKAAKKNNVALENIDGAIVVDQNSQSSINNVYAVGDCACAKFNPTNTQQYIPQATNAIRQGVSAAASILHNYATNQKVSFDLIPSTGSQYSSAAKVFDMVMASTGLNTHQAKEHFHDVRTSQLTILEKPLFSESNQEVTIRVIYREESKILLGCQIFGQKNNIELIQIASVFITNKMTLPQIAQQDFAFNPWFGKPVHVMQQVILQALSGAQQE
ncbi:NADH_oxidase [Hexamita inflata]|uniref:NADH oxidase n=1 Tax=Hexamita inflata TaxID=28002 RepID=A0AA86PMY7_9EUKA|nr:NADH oxidase [Hexamita inflata]